MYIGIIAVLMSQTVQASCRPITALKCYVNDPCCSLSPIVDLSSLSSLCILTLSRISQSHKSHCMKVQPALLTKRPKASRTTTSPMPSRLVINNISNVSPFISPINSLSHSPAFLSPHRCVAFHDRRRSSLPYTPSSSLRPQYDPNNPP